MPHGCIAFASHGCQFNALILGIDKESPFQIKMKTERKRIDKLLTYLTYMKNAYILDSCVQHRQATHSSLSILLKRCGCVNMHVAHDHKHIHVGKYTVWWFRVSWLRDFGSEAALTRQVVCNFMHTLHTHTFIVQHFAV